MARSRRQPAQDPVPARIVVPDLVGAIVVVGLAPTALGYAALVAAVAAGTVVEQLLTRRRSR